MNPCLTNCKAYDKLLQNLGKQKMLMVLWGARKKMSMPFFCSQQYLAIIKKALFLYVYKNTQTHTHIRSQRIQSSIKGDAWVTSVIYGIYYFLCISYSVFICSKYLILRNHSGSFYFRIKHSLFISLCFLLVLTRES